MVITFGAVGLGGQETNCIDGVRNFRLSNQDVVQLTPIIRATKPNLHHRGNRSYTASWEVRRQHESAADAEAFVISHAAEFTAAGEVTFASGVASLVLSEAVVTATGGTIGAVTNHSYSVQGTL